jgi:hypothetical protein
MKLSLKSIVVVCLACFGAMRCESGEQFVTKEAGLWNVVLQTNKTFENDVLIVDETLTQDLGQMEFRMTGQGFRIEPSRIDTFVWQLGAEDERMIVYYKVGPWMNAAITNQTDQAMTFAWENEGDLGATHYKWEHTMNVERAK